MGSGGRVGQRCGGGTDGGGRRCRHVRRWAGGGPGGRTIPAGWCVGEFGAGRYGVQEVNPGSIRPGRRPCLGRGGRRLLRPAAAGGPGVGEDLERACRRKRTLRPGIRRRDPRGLGGRAAQGGPGRSRLGCWPGGGGHGHGRRAFRLANGCFHLEVRFHLEARFHREGDGGHRGQFGLGGRMLPAAGGCGWRCVRGLVRRFGRDGGERRGGGHPRRLRCGRFARSHRLPGLGDGAGWGRGWGHGRCEVGRCEVRWRCRPACRCLDVDRIRPRRGRRWLPVPPGGFEAEVEEVVFGGAREGLSGLVARQRELVGRAAGEQQGAFQARAGEQQRRDIVAGLCLEGNAGLRYLWTGRAPPPGGEVGMG